MAEKDSPAAGRVAGALGLIRPGDRHVIDPWDAVHVLEIQVAGEGLQRLVGLRRVAPQECDRDLPRASLHMNSRLQPRIQRVFGDAQIGVRHFVILFAADRRQEDSLAVDADFELMRIFQPRDVPDDVLQQRHRKIVLAIQREVVLDESAAPRAQRQALNMILLSEIRGDLVDLAYRRDGRVAHCQRTDLARGRHILLQQGW